LIIPLTYYKQYSVAFLHLVHHFLMLNPKLWPLPLEFVSFLPPWFNEISVPSSERSAIAFLLLLFEFRVLACSSLFLSITDSQRFKDAASLVILRLSV